ncbi:MAG: adenylate cyclase class 1 [Paraglaciecola psychrophila]|jgi:adenylate cyclase class 1
MFAMASPPTSEFGSSGDNIYHDVGKDTGVNTRSDVDNNSGETASSIDQGVDRKVLNAIRKRFLAVNGGRLARAQSAMSPRQQTVLDLLPLLFHVNHPILPGYVNAQTPCGIAHYQPSKAEIQRAQGLARSFTYHRQAKASSLIEGLFLMGSSGTVAQSNHSDLDIWLCHRDHLSSAEHQLLQLKCDHISQWAMGRQLEVHFFLMEGEKFRRGERESLSTEDCGSAQHILLLDEFYRTSLLLAGKIPIWWLVPPEEDHDYYANALREKRFIKPDEAIDFGGVGHIPAGEFIGAGVWQLYKAIDSPYKSVLKILLTEVYAAEYPAVEPLSTTLKRAIFDNRLDLDEVDPYVMVYRKLEQYLLSRGELSRLELVRRCFYLKVEQTLSQRKPSGVKAWRYQLIESLVGEWQWTAEQLRSLDKRSSWKVGRVVAEQKILVRELTNSYRFVLEFARRSASTALIDSQEVTLLGRKLYAAFERKAEKIEWVNPGIAPDLHEEQLTFFQYPTDDQRTEQWAVSSDTVNGIDQHNGEVLKRADQLTTLLAWCHFNGLSDHHTRVRVIEGEHGVRQYELINMLQSLRSSLPVASQYNSQSDDRHQRFESPMRPLLMHLFINVGVDPLANKRSQGTELISAQTDSLAFSGLRENLVLNLEQVVANSWGELSTRSYRGEQALLLCLRDYLQMLPPGHRPQLPAINIHCFSPTRAQAIAARVEQLFSDISSCFHRGSARDAARYVLEIQGQYHVLQCQGSRPGWQHCATTADLLTHLSAPQDYYSAIVLDRYCGKNSVLRAISEHQKTQQIQVYYQRHSLRTELYILDEMGSLFSYKIAGEELDNILNPLDLFLRAILFRQSSESTHFDHGATEPLQDLQYFEVVAQRGLNHIRPHRLREPINTGGFFKVQAVAALDHEQQLVFDIYCEQREFYAADLGADIYRAAAAFIVDQRRSTGYYPCYISDLDLGGQLKLDAGKASQTVQYLRYKQRLEQQLNSAMKQH